MRLFDDIEEYNNQELEELLNLINRQNTIYSVNYNENRQELNYRLVYSLNNISEKTIKLSDKELKNHTTLKLIETILLRYNLLKRKSKLQSGEKITVVFVCHRAQIWSALKTVFEACNEDEQFETIIVTIPNKKQIPKLGLNHEEYVSEGAEEFYKDYPCRVIQGYDYKNKTWFDLETLNPDYVFFQTPYKGFLSL